MCEIIRIVCCPEPRVSSIFTLVAEDGFVLANSNKHISLPAPLSDGDPVEWFRRFEICCRANDWSDEMKAKKLPTLLEGEAIAVWFELTSEEQASYSTAKEKIIGRMAPANFVSLAEFHKRTLRPGESLSVFAHELKRLLEQALPTADASTSKQLLLHQFINGLPNSLSTQLRAACHINDLKTAMERAKLLMTLKEEPHKTAAVQSTEVAALKDQISVLTEQVAALTTKRNRQPGNVVCYRCRQPGHVQRYCPTVRRCYVCGQPGHLAKECYSGNDIGVPQRGRGYPKKQ